AAWAATAAAISGRAWPTRADPQPIEKSTKLRPSAAVSRQPSPLAMTMESSGGRSNSPLEPAGNTCCARPAAAWVSFMAFSPATPSNPLHPHQKRAADQAEQQGGAPGGDDRGQRADLAQGQHEAVGDEVEEAQRHAEGDAADQAALALHALRHRG